MFKKWIKDQLVIGPLRIIKDIKKHRREVFYAFLASFCYSIFYGIFEYTVMYTNPGYVSKGIITPYINWAIMYTSIIVLMLGVTRVKIEWVILGVFFFLMFEDLIYHICYGIDIQAYPFPVYDWWDDYLASFRVLGNLGQAIPFWPYVPLYYLPGFGMVIVMFVVGFVNAKGARIVNWILEPFILAVIIGLLSNDLFAIIILVVIPSIAYIYIITLVILRKKQKIEMPTEIVQERLNDNDIMIENETEN